MRTTNKRKRWLVALVLCAAWLGGCGDSEKTEEPLPEPAEVKYHVLCVGNSITRHAPSKALGWRSDWGMAASSPDKDYCHRLEAMLNDNNQPSEVTPVNIAVWEQNLELNLDSLLQPYLPGKNIIVIRLGENVQDVELFQTKIYDLISRCLVQTPNVVVTGTFWPNDAKEAVLHEAADSMRLDYIDLGWMTRYYAEKVMPKYEYPAVQFHASDGDYTYYISNDGVLSHPNDLGMKTIAECIYKSLQKFDIMETGM